MIMWMIPNDITFLLIPCYVRIMKEDKYDIDHDIGTRDCAPEL